MVNKYFIYMDARGNVTSREITDYSESVEYLQGYCTSANALRTFRKDRILEEVTNPSILLERMQYHIKNYPPPKPASQPRPKGIEVCFTGFKKSEKEELTSLSESKKLFVKSSVTKNLVFLCYGYNAGPAKLHKACQQGVIILDKDQFSHLLETGEIPTDSFLQQQGS
jgi:NAD-dependent DNA ligase